MSKNNKNNKQNSKPNEIDLYDTIKTPSAFAPCIGVETLRKGGEKK